jgi:hypothetical protein
MPAFVRLAPARQNRPQQDPTPRSNALIESVNTKIRLLTRIAFGFRSPRALIATAMHSLGGHRPILPGRTKRTGQSVEPS